AANISYCSSIERFRFFCANVSVALAKIAIPGRQPQEHGRGHARSARAPASEWVPPDLVARPRLRHQPAAEPAPHETRDLDRRTARSEGFLPHVRVREYEDQRAP